LVELLWCRWLTCYSFNLVWLIGKETQTHRALIFCLFCTMSGKCQTNKADVITVAWSWNWSCRTAAIWNFPGLAWIFDCELELTCRLVLFCSVQYREYVTRIRGILIN
jgi:hypothetical protein